MGGLKSHDAWVKRVFVFIMTYVAKKEYCRHCDKMHPVGACEEPWFPKAEEALPVDKTSNVKGAYHTLYFKCPKCNFSFVLLNSNYCSDCGVKLNWK